MRNDEFSNLIAPFGTVYRFFFYYDRLMQRVDAYSNSRLHLETKHLICTKASILIMHKDIVLKPTLVCEHI